MYLFSCCKQVGTVAGAYMCTWVAYIISWPVVKLFWTLELPACCVCQLPFWELAELPDWFHRTHRFLPLFHYFTMAVRSSPIFRSCSKTEIQQCVDLKPFEWWLQVLYLINTSLIMSWYVNYLVERKTEPKKKINHIEAQQERRPKRTCVWEALCRLVCLSRYITSLALSLLLALISIAS